jgi:hypothetical protein
MSGKVKKAGGRRALADDLHGSASLGEADLELQAIRDRMSDTDKQAIAKLTIEHIRQHARAHGSFTGFADFLAQCDQIISDTRVRRGKVAVTLANSLARDISSIRDMSEPLPPEMKALLFRGMTTGFLFANLRREVDAAKKVAPRKARRSAKAKRAPSIGRNTIKRRV